MKVLQTIGRHQRTSQEGIFQYYRTCEGVYIDGSVGQASSLNPPGPITVSNDEWNAVLLAIENSPLQTFRLTQPTSGAAGEAPTQVLQQIVRDAVSGAQWRFSTSWLSYICAILEHEGSVDLHGGRVGPIPLAKGSPASITDGEGGGTDEVE